ncbi:MAG: lipopolysaccharide heptosyltransferase II [Gammaproteobacteria bacterium]|nr:lipopolysaccharide heptosyltransferase II [Gammaproteobacteria bacterium]
MPTPVKQILVVGPSWVGDMVMAQSLFITLQQTYPNAAIDVLAPAWSEPILNRMPEVRSAITQPVGHGEFGLLARYRLGKQLRQRCYDRAIVIPRSFKSALVPFFARIPTRIGYKGEMRFGLINQMRELDKSVLTQTVQRFVALGLPQDAPLPPAIPEPKLTVDNENQQRVLQKLGLTLDRPAVGLMPGAEYGPAKRWPEAHFAGVADYLVEQGYQVWLLGSEKDRAAAEAIQRTSKHPLINLCGKTSLQDVVDLMAAMRLAVTNDSGLMHIAAAVGVPLVAIYGSSTPAYTPPLTQRAAVLYQGLSCSPCFERVCPLGHTQCLTSITVDKVIKAVQDMSSAKAIIT